MLQPTDDLEIKLTVNEWNDVLNLLGDGPYKKVAPIVAKINQQAMVAAGEVPPVPSQRHEGPSGPPPAFNNGQGEPLNDANP